MGKRKRSKSPDSDSEYSTLLKKVKKLERKLRKRRHRLSSSEPESIIEEPTGVDTPRIEDSLPCPDEPIEVEVNQLETEKQPDLDPGLDPEILQILGDDTSNQNIFGENLHKDITTRWTHILKNGLPKEIKSELLKQYLIPENCSTMKAPKLNPEIKAALTEINLKKENYNENKQNQLASCLAALGKAINSALCTATSQDILKPLSDAGRLLCDFHYKESQSRRYAIINTLNKQVRDTVKDTKIDDFLFGSDLAEHLKSSKAITKQGTEMKSVPPRTQYKPSPLQPQRGALNARGASRAVTSDSRGNPTPRRPAASATSKDHRRETSNRSYASRQRTRRR